MGTAERPLRASSGSRPGARRHAHAPRTGASPPDDPLPALLAERERFLAFLARRVRDPSAAEDLLQAAFAKVLAKGSAPRDAQRVIPWFFRVLRRTLVDDARRRAAGQRALATRARRDARPDPALEDAVCACVGALLRTLPAEHQDILRRVEIEGASPREAAGSLGLTPNAAAVRAHRARAALLRRVRDLCGACAEHRCLRCACGEGQAGAGGAGAGGRGGAPRASGAAGRAGRARGAAVMAARPRASASLTPAR